MSIDATPPAASPIPSMMERMMEIARGSVMEELVSGIAHEVNQPLGAIAAFAQAGERMLDRPQPMVAEALSVLRQIAIEAFSAGDGIRRIRALFNQEGSRMSRCDIGNVLATMQPLLRGAVDRRNGTLDIEVQAQLPPIVADELRLQHVLYTLVQNAVEASGELPRVTLRISGDRYGVEVSVSDAGSGIPETARQQIFRPFFTTKVNGTGLGLASTRAIVEAHEGTIGFADAVGGGTRFWFKLPAAALETTADDMPQRSTAS